LQILCQVGKSLNPNPRYVSVVIVLYLWHTHTAIQQIETVAEDIYIGHLLTHCSPTEYSCICGCSVVSMAHRYPCCQTHFPVFFCTRPAAEDVVTLSMASATSPWCGSCELPSLVNCEIGRLHVWRQAVEAKAVSPNFWRGIPNQRPRLPAPIWKAWSSEFGGWGGGENRRRAFPA